MEKQKSKPALSLTLGPILFGILFVIFIVLLGIATFMLQPNLNGISGILFSLMCAFPVAVILLIRFIRANKFKWYITYVVPALVFPLCIALFLGWTAYEQRPTNIFRVFVADPIPSGVSNIRAQDVSVGIDQTIILAFNATPNAIDKIIKANNLTLSEYETPDPEFGIFKDIEVDEKWTTYDFDDRKIDITMWVNPEKDTVLVRWFDF